MKKSTLLFFIVAGVFALLILLCWSFAYAPNFSLFVLGIVIVVVMYVLSEQWVTHDANEFENRFWTSVACALSCACVFVDDSPVSFGKQSPVLAWFVVGICTFLVHNYDRHIRRSFLTRGPALRRANSSLFTDRDAIRKSLEEVNELLGWIDMKWLSSTFSNLFLLPHVLYIERKIIAKFAEASTEELNYLVTNAELGLIFYKVKDHKFAKQLNRTKLLETLIITRIAELNVASRVNLIDGLQRMKLSAHPRSVYFVTQIITKTTGDDLSELKCLTDLKGDFNSLHKLVHEDIRDPVSRKQILDHIDRQARFQRAHMSLRTSNTSRRRGQFAWRKILSDVDDTLLSSGGSYPAGIDTSYPKRCLYPGVLAFYKELDMGTVGSDTWDESRIGNLVFLSARPHVYKDASENASYKMFLRLQATHGLYTSPTLLAGNLASGSQLLLGGAMEPIALKKLENFKEYAVLYPEFKFLFVGDNGQGDVRTAELIQSDPKLRDLLERSYMHEVQDLEKTHCSDPATKSRQNPNICYFVTYIDAAIDAYKRKLIRLSGLRNVAVEAVADFRRINWNLEYVTPPGKHHGMPSVKDKLNMGYKRDLRLLELNRSLHAANAILLREGLVPVSILRFPCLFRRGTVVASPMGTGVVDRFRPQDGFYEVVLQWGITNRIPGENFGIRRQGVGCFVGYFRPSCLSVVSSRSMSVGIMKSFWLSGSKNKKDKRRVSVSSPAPLASKNASPSTSTMTIVWTPYGFGKMVGRRPVLQLQNSTKGKRQRVEEMMTVELFWGGKLYCEDDIAVHVCEVQIPVTVTPAATKELAQRLTQSMNIAKVDNKESGISAKDHVLALAARLSITSPLRTLFAPLASAVKPLPELHGTADKLQHLLQLLDKDNKTVQTVFGSATLLEVKLTDNSASASLIQTEEAQAEPMSAPRIIVKWSWGIGFLNIDAVLLEVKSVDKHSRKT